MVSSRNSPTVRGPTAQHDGRYHEASLLQVTMWEVEKAISSSIIVRADLMCSPCTRICAGQLLLILCRIPSGRTVLTSMTSKKVPKLRESKGLASS